ncbi:MAG TPA: hypothetical protein DCY20_06335 [Firmicutes bacterium]|nr:hypothetical protein [Bacillota bacterium]
MQKTQLGMPVTIVATTLYLLGLINYVCLLVMVGYVLLYERDEWLRKCAIKSVVFILCFGFLNVVFRMGNDVLGVLNGFLTWFDAPFQLVWPFNINVILQNALNFIQSILLMLLGFKALHHKDLKLPIVDKIMNQYMS